MSTTERKAPEQRTIDVDVDSLDTRGRTVHGYAAVYNTLSEDMCGSGTRLPSRCGCSLRDRGSTLHALPLLRDVGCERFGCQHQLVSFEH